MTDEKGALEALGDHYTLDECPKCEVPEEWGLVLGDADCAIGVAACPHCGVHLRVLSADPAGVIGDFPYSQMLKLAWDWIPDWAADREDTRTDWVCACGETWKTSRAAREHIYRQHPDKTRLRSQRHDRYPWDNVPEQLRVSDPQEVSR